MTFPQFQGHPVKPQVKAKMKKVRSSLNLDLNLPQKLRPRWTAILTILRVVHTPSAINGRCGFPGCSKGGSTAC